MRCLKDIIINSADDIDKVIGDMIDQAVASIPESIDVWKKLKNDPFSKRATCRQLLTRLP